MDEVLGRSGAAASVRSRPRIVLLRGHYANPWDLRPWRLLEDSYDITCVVTPSNEFELADPPGRLARVRSRRDRFPPGRLGRALIYAAGDRYVDLEPVLRQADIVHSADIHTWFSAQAAALSRQLGFRLVLTVWETIPFLSAYRWPRERRYRGAVLGVPDLYLPATKRACRALMLEGVPEGQLRVCYPGIDTSKFSPQSVTEESDDHLVLSPGRLVWEKGHQDVLRAVAALSRGLVGSVRDVRLLIVGSGPEAGKLRRHAAELNVEDRVEFRASVPYDQMPRLYRQASAVVLASLPRRGWEEQFGMVLAEAMASGTRIVAARSGAISEVVGDEALHFEPGDWFGLARVLLEGPLSRAPGHRVAYPAERIELFSLDAAAARLDDAYSRVLNGRRR